MQEMVVGLHVISGPNRHVYLERKSYPVMNPDFPESIGGAPLSRTYPLVLPYAKSCLTVALIISAESESPRMIADAYALACSRVM